MKVLNVEYNIHTYILLGVLRLILLMMTTCLHWELLYQVRLMLMSWGAATTTARLTQTRDTTDNMFLTFLSEHF